MKFDYEQFLNEVGVPYVTSGPNTKKGWVSIACPFCGDDPSEHLGLSPESGGWACWRNPEHKGGSPVKIIQYFKGCSWDEAKRIAGDTDAVPTGESWDSLEQELATDDLQTTHPESLEFPDEFRTIDNVPSFFRQYIINRKFNPEDVDRFCRDYQLRFCLEGKWKRRVICPLIDHKQRVIGWQGRAIGTAKLRYDTWPHDETTKRALFNHGPALAAPNKRVLTVIEGPWDAYKIDFYGRRWGIRGVGTLGTQFIDYQVSLIQRLASKYDYTVLLFDIGAEGPVYDLSLRLSNIRPIIGRTPEYRDDAGDLYPREVRPVIMSIIRNAIANLK